MTIEVPSGVTVVADGPVRIVRLDRPEFGNAFTGEIHDGFADLWLSLSADDEVGCMVLTGAGRMFCTGGDVDWMASMISSESAQRRAIAGDQRILSAMRNCPVPIIAAINGPAVGLGCSVALMCDLALIGRSAFIADPHVSIGLVAGDGGAAALPFLIPFMRAKQFLYTGDRISPELAVELGLAIGVFDDDRLMAEALELAHRIARQPRAALQATKRAVNMHLDRAMANVAEVASAAEAVTMAAPQFAESVRPLVEREQQRRARLGLGDPSD